VLGEPPVVFRFVRRSGREDEAESGQLVGTPRCERESRLVDEERQLIGIDRADLGDVLLVDLQHTRQVVRPDRSDRCRVVVAGSASAAVGCRRRHVTRRYPR